MAQFISNELPSMLTTFAGLWMDSPDIKSKYKDKPEQLEAVCAHTNKFVRLVNGWNLFEDVQYQSGFEADEIRTKKRMMDCSPEEAPKATVAYERPPEAAVASEAGGTTNIAENETAQINECLDSLSMSAERLQTFNELIGLGLDKQKKKINECLNSLKSPAARRQLLNELNSKAFTDIFVDHAQLQFKDSLQFRTTQQGWATQQGRSTQ